MSPSTTINGVNGIKFEEGTITINSDAASKLVLTDPTISTLGTQTINANIGGTVGLTRASGTLVLTLGGNNTYTGVTTINTGRVTITSNTALGSSASLTGDYTTFAPAVSGLGVNISGDGLNIPEPIILTGGSGLTNVGPGQIENLGGNNVWSGQITLAGSSSTAPATGLVMIGVTAGTLTISSPMVPLNPVASTISAFAKTGAGTLVLSAANTYTGITRILGGTLVAQVNNAFGTAAGGFAMASGAGAYQPEMILLQPAATAGASASVNYSTVEAAGALAGTNYAGHGLLESSAGIGVGSNVYSGAIQLGNNDPFGSQDINVVQPTTIGVASGTLTLNGTGIANSSTSDQRSLVKVGPGELRLQTAGTFAGPTIVDTGTLSFWGSAGGANGLSNISSNFTVNAGASLKYENTDNAKPNRITAQGGLVRLFGGDFTMSGVLRNTVASVTTTNVGSELDAYGTSSITMTSPGAGAVLDLSAATSPAPFSRVSNATVVFRGATLGTAAAGSGISTVRLPAALQTLVGSGSAGTPNVGIIPGPSATRTQRRERARILSLTIRLTPLPTACDC